MKTNSQTIIAVLVAANIALLSTVEGAFPGFTIGTLERVEEHCISQTETFDIELYQTIKPGYYARVGNEFYINLRFQNKAEADVFYREKLAIACQKAIETTDPDINKDAPLQISALFYQGIIFDVLCFQHKPFSTVLLVKSNGTYYIPDLSSYKMVPCNHISYEIPKLKWARIEIYNTGSKQPTIVHDPRYEPNEWITGIGLVYVSRIDFIDEFILNSGTGGKYNMKITVISGDNHDFQVFNGMGEQVPETPLYITGWRKISSDPLKFACKINGGDPGRIVQFQGSVSSDGPWQDIGDKYVVNGFHSNVPSLDCPPINAIVPAETKKFFRIRTVDGIPW